VPANEGLPAAVPCSMCGEVPAALLWLLFC
jgi:hypothetical protein